MPKKNEYSEDLEDETPPTTGEHVFTDYACDCGESWPKDQGNVCPNCKREVPS